MAEADVKSNVFTEEGRLLQTEYAIKNVGKAGTIIGMICTDGVVLLGVNTSETTNTLEKIYKLDERTYCAVSGLFGDAHLLIKYARQMSANICEDIESVVKTSVLCSIIGEKKQKYTQYCGSRPFGVSMLYAGRDDGEYVLYSTDPSGTVNRWKAFSYGMDDESINGILRSDYSEMPIKEGTQFLLKTLGKARECTSEIASKLEILQYSENQTQILSKTQIKELFE